MSLVVKLSFVGGPDLADGYVRGSHPGRVEGLFKPPPCLSDLLLICLQSG